MRLDKYNDINKALISLNKYADSDCVKNQLIRNDFRSLKNKHSFSGANEPSFHMNSAIFDAITIICNDVV